ncbi:DUF6850 family outer membrane beta-barrel protein [Chitinophaga niabensis]|uniref:DUF6850 family outer membrane beta-barrel protein n=1 Tax=Chitinophaga niabensis TaxID=536979 RepID=UPI0031B9DB8A
MKRVLILCLSLLSATAFAQTAKVADSIYFFKQSRQDITYRFRNASQLVADTFLQKTGRLDVSYSQTQGGFHLSQEPYKTQIAELYTEGIATLGRIKVSGQFRFNKVWEDSLANNLSGEVNPISPYFYFATKAGRYERQNYNGIATVAYALLKDQLYLSGGFEYDHHWTTGSVDPRAEVQRFKLLVKPGITYKYRKHVIGAEGIIGYGNESSSIIYKNMNFGLSLLYPDRIYYLNHAYGYIGMKDEAIYQRLRNYKGGSLSYYTTVGNWRVRALLSYEIEKERNTRERRAKSRLDIYSRWDIDTWSGELQLQRNTARSNQQFNVFARIRDGKDFDSVFAANNYQYQQQQAGFSYLHQSVKRAHFQPEWGVHANFDRSSRIDVVQAHTAEYTQVNAGLTANGYWNFKNGDRFSAGITPSLRIPLESTITVPPTQENIFTRAIAYPDYYYWSSTAFRINTSFRYISSKTLKEMPVGFFVNVGYTQRLNEDAAQYPAMTKPDKMQWTTNLGFTLYL